MLTLKDGFSGGETTFSRLGASWRGRAGDAVFFRNTDEEENPYKDSLHAGAPVTQGEKWILTLWFRARRFWFWP